MKHPKTLINIICVLFLGMFISCDDIIERNIETEKPVLLSPLDSMIEFGTLTFWWTEIDGATGYRLQLISPSFASPQRLYLDTLVGTEQFDFNPQPGVYEWRVQAINSAYESQFSDASPLEILEGSDLSRFKLVLTAPAKNGITNNQEVSFKWQAIPIADAYRLQVFSSTGTVLDDTTNLSVYNFTLPQEDGTYQWQVTAFNEETTSASEKFNLVLDQTNPLDPELIFPKEDSLVDFTSNLRFTWTRRSSDVVTDLFNITYEDGSEVPGFSAQELEVSFIELSNQDATFKADSVYIWSVISVDFAGNQSEPVQRAFRVAEE